MSLRVVFVGRQNAFLFGSFAVTATRQWSSSLREILSPDKRGLSSSTQGGRWALSLCCPCRSCRPLSPRSSLRIFLPGELPPLFFLPFSRRPCGGGVVSPGENKTTPPPPPPPPEPGAPPGPPHPSPPTAINEFLSFSSAACGKSFRAGRGPS